MNNFDEEEKKTTELHIDIFGIAHYSKPRVPSKKFVSHELYDDLVKCLKRLYGSRIVLNSGDRMWSAPRERFEDAEELLKALGEINEYK